MCSYSQLYGTITIYQWQLLNSNLTTITYLWVGNPFAYCMYISVIMQPELIQVT